MLAQLCFAGNANAFVSARSLTQDERLFDIKSAVALRVHCGQLMGIDDLGLLGGRYPRLSCLR